MNTLLLIASLGAAALPAAFFDVSIERRCESLAEFVRTYAERELPALGVKPLSCSEGNGLGGARYRLEFTTDDKKAGTQHVDLAMSDDPASVTVTHEGPQGRRLAAALEAWAKTKPTRTVIFGEDYFLFATGLTKQPMTYWAGDEAKHDIVEMKLEPDASGPMSGRVKLIGEAPAAFLKCFACADKKCFEDEVRYKLSQRLFSLTRDTAKSGSLGAGWIMTGPAPVPKDGPTWRYACGASRYSLTMTSPAGGATP